MIYVIGCYILVTVLYSFFSKNNTYQSFLNGIIDGLKIVVNMFSVLLVFNFAIKCIESCGIVEYLLLRFNDSGFINIILQCFIRPISSGSSYAIMVNIFEKYGVDSVYGYLSSYIHSTCDTLFYIVTIYCAHAKIKGNNVFLKNGLITICFSYLMIFICYYIFFN